MPFTGQAEASIDAKQRLALPAKFRSRWDPERDGKTWFCLPSPDDAVLLLFTEHQFESMRVAGSDPGQLMPGRDVASVESTIYGFAEQLDVDANNRIRLPAWHLELVVLPKDVIVNGAGNRLEIRSREAWMAEREQRFRDLRHRLDRVERDRRD